MTGSAQPAAAGPMAVSGPLRAEVDLVWPAAGPPLPAGSAVLAGVAGIVGAVLLPEAPPGLGLTLVGLLVAAAALPAGRHRIGAHEIAFGAVAALVLSVVAVRDAPWFVAICLLGTLGLASYALAPARSIVATLLGGLSLPMAALRSLPRLRRGLSAYVSGRTVPMLTAVRVLAVTTALVLVFGALFSSADGAFAALVPRIDLDLLPVRTLIVVTVSGLALSTAFLAASPPRWDVLAPRSPRPVRTLEWAVPIAALDALFAAFVVVQIAVLFGGRRHVLETAGLTYAEYARGGFAQLMTVTVLTLSVVAAAVRWAPRRTRRQRVVLRVLLGALATMALLVVASALYRLHLYEEAFGFTRLRLFMNVFETWLGALIVLVLVAGIRLRARWLPRAAVASAGGALLVLAAVNPDAFVASRNVERYQATGSVDVVYLQGLSADAIPVLDRLPEPLRSCVLAGMAPVKEGGLAGWNLGRARATDVLARHPVRSDAACPGD